MADFSADLFDAFDETNDNVVEVIPTSTTENETKDEPAVK